MFTSVIAKVGWFMIPVVRSSPGLLIGWVFFSLILVGLLLIFVRVILLFLVWECTARGSCAEFARIRPVFSLMILIIRVRCPIIFSIPQSFLRTITRFWLFLALSFVNSLFWADSFSIIRVLRAHFSNISARLPLPAALGYCKQFLAAF